MRPHKPAHTNSIGREARVRTYTTRPRRANTPSLTLTVTLTAPLIRCSSDVLASVKAGTFKEDLNNPKLGWKVEKGAEGTFKGKADAQALSGKTSDATSFEYPS